MSEGRTKAPCRGCTERVMGCHSTCESYQEFLEAHAMEREQIYQGRNEHRQVCPHYFMTEQQFRIAGNNNKRKVFTSKKK